MDAQAPLVYIDTFSEGWRRVRRGRGFAYFTADGKHIRALEELERIRKLAIPPAYTDVWICPSAQGHIQAMGRDAKGRLQYRYHPLWQEQRTQEKFSRMLAFGRCLPAIRRAVEHDLALKKLELKVITAAIVKILDQTGFRIGNEQYALQNKSYGVSTLKNRHAVVKAGRLTLHFRGKSGVMQKTTITDRRIIRIIHRCQELPGQRLFQFPDQNGQLQSVQSEDVNSYLRSISGENFTAKDFRTWHANVCAVQAKLDSIKEQGQNSSPQLSTAEIIKKVAKTIGNTYSVCRNFYIHPHVLRFCEQDCIKHPFTNKIKKSGLNCAEKLFLKILQDNS